MADPDGTQEPEEKRVREQRAEANQLFDQGLNLDRKARQGR